MHALQKSEFNWTKGILWFSLTLCKRVVMHRRIVGYSNEAEKQSQQSGHFLAVKRIGRHVMYDIGKYLISAIAGIPVLP